MDCEVERVVANERAKLAGRRYVWRCRRRYCGREFPYEAVLSLGGCRGMPRGREGNGDGERPVATIERDRDGKPVRLSYKRLKGGISMESSGGSFPHRVTGALVMWADVRFEPADTARVADESLSSLLAAAIGEAMRYMPAGWRAHGWECVTGPRRVFLSPLRLSRG